MQIPPTVTREFFLEHVDFFHIPLTEQAKWLLFFVTRVLRLRDDGMEVGVIADRLADIRGRPISAAELDTIDNYFKSGGGGDVTRTYRNNPRMKPYKIVDAAARTKFFYDLGAGLQVFLSYPSTFGTTAESVYDILRTIGLKPWLDRKIQVRTNATKHNRWHRDSCLIAFLIRFPISRHDKARGR